MKDNLGGLKTEKRGKKKEKYPDYTGQSQTCRLGAEILYSAGTTQYVSRLTGAAFHISRNKRWLPLLAPAADGR